jgi:type II secretory pathway component PulC
MTLVLAVALAPGCASSGAPPDPGARAEGSRLLASEESEAAGRPVACPEFLRPGVLRRAAVVRAVDRGLGQWLSRVRVKPVRAGGRFVGWELLQLYPGDACYAAVDLRPGDVVTRVNGASLEQPDQANEVFQGLRAARALDIELMRQGAARQFSLAIAD